MEHINLEIVKAQRVSTPEGEAVVKRLIERHVELTGSPKGKYVLDNWEHMLPRFWQIVPPGELHQSPVVTRPLRELLVGLIPISSPKLCCMRHSEDRFGIL